MSTITIQLRKKGTITLPQELRRRYELQEGDVFTLVDIGGGSFFLTPRLSQVARLGDQLAAILEEEGVTLEDMLEVLEEEREIYYREQYAQA